MSAVDRDTGEIIGIHPHAECYPLLGEDALAALADDIRENGLVDPVTIATDGRLIDGRNRYRACELIGIEPETVVYEGDDIGAFVRSRNMRRHQSLGSLAMSTALSMEADGLRENGRWKRGSVLANDESVNTDGTWSQRLKECGVILDYKRDLAGAVVNGELALDAAYKQADKIRQSEEHDKIAERERKKREKEEAKAEAERNSQIVADLIAAESEYVALIDDGSMTPAAAWAAHLEDTRKERQEAKELDHSRRQNLTHVAESVRYLTGGEQAAKTFLDAYYPHEDRFLADGMRLTDERVASAIDFLTTIRKGLTR